MGDDRTAQLEEFQLVLDATVAYLRAQASAELDYAAVIRIERAAFIRANAILVDLGLFESTGDGRQVTDELLSAAVSDADAARQDAASQVHADIGPVLDDGPEGVADDVNRQLSDEASVEVEPVIEALEFVESDIAESDEDPPSDFESAGDTDAGIEVASLVAGTSEGSAAQAGKQRGDVEVDSDFDVFDDEPTAQPGTMTPMPVPRSGDYEVEQEEIGELDLEDLVELEDMDFEEGETGEIGHVAASAADASEERPRPLLPDFDFDDDSDEQDATVVFAIGSPENSDIAAMLAEESEKDDRIARLQVDEAAQGVDEDDEREGVASAVIEPESFDLMPDVSGEGADDEVDFGEIEIADDRGALDEMSTDADEEESEDQGPAPLDMGASVSIGVGGPRVAVGTGVQPGLYGNPNMPTIREGAAPSAAAVQISATAGVSARGSGGSVFEEEAEVLEVGAIEDYDDEYEEDEDSEVGSGFRLNMQSHDDDDEYEDEDEDEEEEDEDEKELPPAPVIPAGPSPQQISAALKAAYAATESGNMRAGVDLFSDVIDADPDNVAAHVGRGRLFLDLGDYTRAMSDFMVGEEIDESSPEPQVAIGDLYFARKDYRKAIDYFNDALALSPNHAMAVCRRGISHYYRKNYPEALADLRKAESIDEDIPNIGTYITMAKKKSRKR
jgi:tetratricopeptide (TPR) repeat protein